MADRAGSFDPSRNRRRRQLAEVDSQRQGRPSIAAEVMNPPPTEGTTTDHRVRLLRFRLRSQLVKNGHKSWIAAKSVDVGIGLELVTVVEAGSDRHLQCLERAIDELLAL